MQPHPETRRPILGAVLAAAVLAAAGCQQAPPAPSTPQASAMPAASGAPTAAATAAAPATTAASNTAAAPAAAAAPTTAAAPAPPVRVCSLLSAAEVSAVMGKTLVQDKDGCAYGLDPAVKEKQLARGREDFENGARHAAAKGGMNAFLQGMPQAGGKPPRLGAGMAGMAGMLEQMTISVSANRDAQTEAAVKAIYARTGEVVRGALAPERHGLNGVIEGLDELGGVGDWAFATNVAAVNMGMGLSVRGRLLEARKGPWHVTVGATVAPDPGVAALDGRLADLARALMAKL